MLLLEDKLNLGRANDRANYDEPLPVFLISFNRGDVLMDTIAALRQQSRPVEFIINDFGSDEEQTLDVLSMLEQQGVVVYRRQKIHNADELNSVNEIIVDYMGRFEVARRYAVSDCDISFSDSSPDSLFVYEELLDRFQRVECAGPMLRISDIPLDYPLFDTVMNRHIAQFWGQRPVWLGNDGRLTAVLPAPFDTTFAIHRAGSCFKRLKHGLRVYGPYDALHVDWYLTQDAFWDTPYIRSANKEVAHWNSKEFWAESQERKLDYLAYYDVDWQDGHGRTVRRNVLQTVI